MAFVAELAKLADLHKDGALNDAEYAAAKAAVLTEKASGRCKGRPDVLIMRVAGNKNKTREL